MKRPRLYVIVLLLVIASGSRLLFAGELQWEDRTISVEAAPKSKNVEVRYVFTNTSAQPVEISKVSTSCGCATAELAKKIYQPDEKGELSVVFVFGNRTGSQEKSILVRTGDAPPDVLMLRVKIPDAVDFSPSELIWDVGGSEGEQSFTLVVVDSDVRVEGCHSLSKGFASRLEEVEPGKRFRVVVWPLNVERPVRGSVRVDVTTPKPRTIYLPLKVVGPKS